MKRFSWLIFLIVVLLLFYISGLHRHASLAALQHHHVWIKNWALQHRISAALILLACSLSAAALSYPGMAVFALAGGFILGIDLGTLIVLIGNTIGAIVPFLASRQAFSYTFDQHPKLNKTTRHVQQHQCWYLLFVRITPVFPFWLVNLVAGALNLRLRTFIWTTGIGCLPSTVIATAVGSGMNTGMTQGKIKWQKVISC